MTRLAMCFATTILAAFITYNNPAHAQGSCAVLPSFLISLCKAKGKVVDFNKCQCVERGSVVGGLCDVTSALLISCVAQGKFFDSKNCKCVEERHCDGCVLPLATNAIVDRMAEASANKEMAQPQTPTLTELKGYAAQSSTPDMVRLYWDLSLSRYWDIPANAIIHQVPGSDPKNDPVKLYVSSSTPIVTGTTMPADAVVTQKAIIDHLGTIPFEGPGIGAGAGQPAEKSWTSGALQGASFGCLAGSAAACSIVFGAGLASGWVLQ
jgi:hypothetical protein